MLLCACCGLAPVARPCFAQLVACERSEREFQATLLKLLLADNAKPLAQGAGGAIVNWSPDLVMRSVECRGNSAESGGRFAPLLPVVARFPATIPGFASLYL